MALLDSIKTLPKSRLKADHELQELHAFLAEVFSD